MAYELKKLGDFCRIMTGAPLCRAKKLASGDEDVSVQVLIPRAMEDGRIIDSELVREKVSKVKKDLFTKERDVIVKASTPYDCAYIDKAHEGVLVTSFGIILRAKTNSAVDMKYLISFLSQPHIKKELQNMSVGATIQLIKKAAISSLKIPVVPEAQQRKLAVLYDNTQARKEQCLKLIATSEKLLKAEFSKTVFN